MVIGGGKSKVVSLPSREVTTQPCNRIIQVSSERKSYTKLSLYTHLLNNEQGGQLNSTFYLAHHMLFSLGEYLSHRVSSQVLDSPKKGRKESQERETGTKSDEVKRKDNYHLRIYGKVCGILGPQ